MRNKNVKSNTPLSPLTVTAELLVLSTNNQRSDLTQALIPDRERDQIHCTVL